MYIDVEETTAAPASPTTTLNIDVEDTTVPKTTLHIDVSDRPTVPPTTVHIDVSDRPTEPPTTVHIDVSKRPTLPPTTLHVNVSNATTEATTPITTTLHIHVANTTTPPPPPPTTLHVHVSNTTTPPPPPASTLHINVSNTTTTTTLAPGAPNPRLRRRRRGRERAEASCRNGEPALTADVTLQICSPCARMYVNVRSGRYFSYHAAVQACCSPVQFVMGLRMGLQKGDKMRLNSFAVKKFVCDDISFYSRRGDADLTESDRVVVTNFVKKKSEEAIVDALKGTYRTVFAEDIAQIFPDLPSLLKLANFTVDTRPRPTALPSSASAL